ncbi:MAG: hypothetical protein M3M85_02225, partial [bacterium]|nr:hypothetical protein [bacterium]
REDTPKNYSRLVFMQESVNFISDLCGKIYEIDNTFPNFALLDEEKFMEAAKKELEEDLKREEAYEPSKKGRELTTYSMGRFAVIERGDDLSADYYILDQQAKKVNVGGKIYGVEEGKNGGLIVAVGSKHLLFTESGNMSEKFGYIEPATGELYIARRKKESFALLDKEGRIVRDNIYNYIASDDKKRALITVPSGYNILLEDGGLLLDVPEDNISAQFHSSDGLSYDGKKIGGNLTLYREDHKKTVTLDKNLKEIKNTARDSKVA